MWSGCSSISSPIPSPLGLFLVAGLRRARGDVG
ncbi:MYXO-CTERM sorting domain-containing protein [Muribaculum sp.]|nr:hypothetical protein [Muribaculum sp.]